MKKIFKFESRERRVMQQREKRNTLCMSAHVCKHSDCNDVASRVSASSSNSDETVSIRAGWWLWFVTRVHPLQSVDRPMDGRMKHPCTVIAGWLTVFDRSWLWFLCLSLSLSLTLPDSLARGLTVQLNGKHRVGEKTIRMIFLTRLACMLADERYVGNIRIPADAWDR